MLIIEGKSEIIPIELADDPIFMVNKDANTEILKERSKVISTRHYHKLNLNSPHTRMRNSALAAENKSREERGASEGPGSEMGTRKITVCGQGGRDAGQEARATTPAENVGRAI